LTVFFITFYFNF